MSEPCFLLCFQLYRPDLLQMFDIVEIGLNKTRIYFGYSENYRFYLGQGDREQSKQVS